MKNDYLTQKKPLSALIVFALPMIVGNLFQQTYTMADSAIVGRLVGELGVEVLLAVGPRSRAYMVPEAQAAGCPDVRWYENRDAAREDLLSLFTPGSAVLLKASHFLNRFDLMADCLRDYPF